MSLFWRGVENSRWAVKVEGPCLPVGHTHGEARFISFHDARARRKVKIVAQVDHDAVGIGAMHFPAQAD